VDGRIIERNVGEKEHGRMQRALLRYLARYHDAGLEAWPEQRIQIRADHFRVVDVCVTIGEPEGQIFTTVSHRRQRRCRATSRAVQRCR
jgi:hypothetical protein